MCACRANRGGAAAVTGPGAAPTPPHGTRTARRRWRVAAVASSSAAGLRTGVRVDPRTFRARIRVEKGSRSCTAKKYGVAKPRGGRRVASWQERARDSPTITHITPLLSHGGMRADSEHLAPAAGAAIACAFLALGLMLLRQMARQEQVLREILRMHQELLDSTRLLILTQQEIRSVTAPGSEVLKRRQSLTGSDSDAGPWYRDTGATLAPARTGSRVPAAPRLESASQPQTFPRSFSAPNKFAQAGPRQIVATSSQTVRFSRCTSGPAGSRDLAPAAPRLASAQPRRPRSSTSSGISFCKPAARPPAASSLSQHSALACRQAAVSMSAGWGASWQALALFVHHCS